jgi:hypothetical protein
MPMPAPAPALRPLLPPLLEGADVEGTEVSLDSSLEGVGAGSVAVVLDSVVVVFVEVLDEVAVVDVTGTVLEP